MRRAQLRPDHVAHAKQMEEIGVPPRLLFDAGLEWAWSRGAERVRLIVHEDNPRAQGFYRKAGFVPSGKVVPLEGHEGENELEFVLEKG